MFIVCSILCFEILAKKYRQWLLRYVPGAIAETDAPQTLVELIKQRRRWLNGSFFALVYYLYHFPRFMGTSHGFFRKLLLCCQFCFLGTTAFVAWFNVALLYLSFVMVINTTISYAPFGVGELQMAFSFFYLMLIFLQIVSGLAGKVNQMHTLYFTTLISYAIIMTFSVVFGIWLVTNQTLTAYVGLAFALALFSYLFAACFHGALFKSAIMFPQYLMMIPTFVNVFPIYSFCKSPLALLLYSIALQLIICLCR
jgi:chitin synthase